MLHFFFFYIKTEKLLLPFTNYFEVTRIGRPNGRRTQRPPIFCLAQWNQYNATLADLPKTNNCVEGFLRAFSSLLDAFHQTVGMSINRHN